jgi:hypothetical protein
MVLVALTLFFAAPFIRSFGYGGWVVGVLVSAVLPFTIAMLAGRPVWIPGVIGAAAIAASFPLHDVVLKTNRVYVGGSEGFFISCFGMELAFGLTGAAAAHLLMRPTATTGAKRFDVIGPPEHGPEREG